ncbi:uncharacterized protein PGTG_22191 [Puccinia graminis f. sp. tritici CRL 75-36-700-3]|uniref:Uncharacterized protein n=1 Tax=Puccinia graminis f. sp. tritici (strain CRL 75-36-700-3 / race SCCL) TaxID=418459 RepID=H6QTT6_PUCGT|nr:uncharacterized protein PGTG_22191 [Puccinia graminis f. sp. tritici CRL 75-36-700-3]EHS64367.1 hypothetical protein PGTG_22191 [Puccinia graminis f. sp. tritici CRL 75-36-700-3]
MESAPEAGPRSAMGTHQPAAPPPMDFPLLSFFRAIRADPNRGTETGTLDLDATTDSLILQLIESYQ